MVVPAALSAGRLPAPSARVPRVPMALSFALHGLAVLPLFLIAGTSGQHVVRGAGALRRVRPSPRRPWGPTPSPTVRRPKRRRRRRSRRLRTVEAAVQPPEPPTRLEAAIPPPEPPLPLEKIPEPDVVPEIKVDLPPPEEPPPLKVRDLKPVEPPKPSRRRSRATASPHPARPRSPPMSRRPRPHPTRGNAAVTQQATAAPRRVDRMGRPAALSHTAQARRLSAARHRARPAGRGPGARASRARRHGRRNPPVAQQRLSACSTAPRSRPCAAGTSCRPCATAVPSPPGSKFPFVFICVEEGDSHALDLEWRPCRPLDPPARRDSRRCASAMPPRRWASAKPSWWRWASGGPQRRWPPTGARCSTTCRRSAA